MPLAHALAHAKLTLRAITLLTDKTKLKLDREVGGGCFFCFHVWQCFINFVAKEIDVLFLCVSGCVSFTFSFFFFLSSS